MAVLGKLGRWRRVYNSSSGLVNDCIDMGRDLNLPWYSHLKDILTEVNLSTELELVAKFT